ncbi:MAG TPA: indole-3-glycerol-phosphate synthase TrpC [Gemmatimonadota bacterium]|nr:indole-3-glycerol-phosphate synthase TrpC [Gemmatimonadota bacterium]
MADFLAGMAIASRRRAHATMRRVPLAELRARAADRPPPPGLTLSADGFDVIAEIKRRSPGGDGARVDIRPDRRAVAYADGGAVAISVLTEPLAFDGSLDDLAAAARALERFERPIPTMRKDFVVEPYQLFEARAAGGGGVLLIADLLATLDAGALLDAAAEAGVWVLIEAFADAHVDHAARLARLAADRGVRALVGVNVRDLRTLDVDPGRLARVAERLPRDLPRVAESGMLAVGDVAAAARLGYGLALVGRALSGASDPRGLLAGMLRAGRAGHREAACA